MRTLGIMTLLSYGCVCQFFLLLLLPSLPAAVLAVDHYNRADFPADFIFGSGTAAAQYEGAAFEDGRTASIWDTFAYSGRTHGATGDIACNGYHKYKEDVGLMVDTGLDALRISISWSRLIPKGRGPINAKGLQYYNNLINELISHGIEPHITLYHLDLPQVLEDEYEGWVSRNIVKDFVEFADVCFREFGDRISHWTTINEANIAAIGGYNEGIIAPGRCSLRTRCDKGDSATEVYTVLHNMLLAHSAAANLYKEKYKAIQKGYVGINIYTIGLVPFTNSTEDVKAAKRVHEFYIGWVIKPLMFGDYPDIVKKRAKKRIPSFTKKEAEQLRGSFDFIGLNHYTTVFIKDNPSPQSDIMNFYADMAADLIIERGDAKDGLYPIMAWGLQEVLEYLKQTYGNPPVYIHENGQSTWRNGTLNDTGRVEYLQAYIGKVLDAVRNGSNVKGYFEWTFLDCLELLDGWTSSFGLYYVDLDDIELTRYQKLSARWYSDFLKNKSNRPRTITQVTLKDLEHNRLPLEEQSEGC